MIRASLEHLPPIIDWCIDVSSSDRQYRKEMMETGRLFTSSRRLIIRAEEAARRKLDRYGQVLKEGWLPEEALSILAEEGDCALQSREERAGSAVGLDIALLGHAYTVYDEYVSQQVIKKLEGMGVRVTTLEMLPDELIEREAGRLPKRMFWTLGKKIIGAAYHFLDSGEYDGIIHLACFGCGPDSLVAELVAIEAQRRKQPPFMMLTLDEHTGEAGTITRLEAFVDLVQRSKSLKRLTASRREMQ
jgi:predicted nucleotide-binding protein (sugar kinase/HSP70/actin superfamily)